MSNLFSELKRRNVIRVAAAYLVVSWLLVQVLGLAANSFEAPAWVMKMLITVLAIGFIPALLFSWAYELTPEGLKKDSEVDPTKSHNLHTANKLNIVTLVAVIAAGGMFVYQLINPTPHSVLQDANSVISSQAGNQSDTKNTETKLGENSKVDSVNQTVHEKEHKSIAVLPFVNMSSDVEQDYFADGISEEILNVLVRIPNLKVAGRTSSFSFKGKNEDLRIIGDALDVNHVLEGSVRRSNTKLRITAQLIRSEDGFHLWSETYDREMADIFDIQDEIAKAVADQMVISLGLDVKTTEQNRTADLEVYEDYLKAKQLFIKRGRENLETALDLVNKATIRDPSYAPAWTLKAYIYNVYDSYVSDEDKNANFKEWRAISKSSAEHALQLDPESAEAYVVLGNANLEEFKLIQAYENYEKAIALAPENPVILDTIAQNIIHLGYFEKARKYSEKAISIDPLVAIYRNTLGLPLVLLNRDEEAIENFEKSIQLDPTLPFPHNNLQWLFFNPKDIEKFKTISQLRLTNVTDASGLEVTKLAIELANNKTLLANVEKVKVLSRESDSIPTRYLLTAYLNDADNLVDLLVNYGWASENRRILWLFITWQQANMYPAKRWKQQVRKDGVLALWQAKGFPSHCKPVGDDDFDCVPPSNEK